MSSGQGSLKVRLAARIGAVLPLLGRSYTSLVSSAILVSGTSSVSCTSLSIEPRNEHEGVVIGHAWSINFLTITIPLAPRQRAMDLVANATLNDVRNAEVEEWPDLIWPINWLNGLLGFCAAEVRADYGLPAPESSPSFPLPAGEPGSGEKSTFENTGAEARGASGRIGESP